MLAIAPPSYDAAADAWMAGAARAGEVVDDLSAGLSRTGGMGGDDTASADFVAGYDASAREAVGALDDLVVAFATLARLTHASGGRHRAADAEAVIGAVVDLVLGGAGPDPAGLDPTDHPAPPSALGHDSSSTPAAWDLVVDHLQGWAWPSADVDRLRTAGALWRRTGEGVGDLATWVELAEDALGDQRSPEVPLALAAAAELRGHLAELGAVCTDLSGACEEYADEVVATREAVGDLVRDLAIELGATVLISGALSLVTLGGSAIVGATAATARAIACARRVVALLEALRTVRAISVAARTLPRVRGVRSALAKFRNVEHAAAARGGAGRAEWQLTKRFRKYDDGSQLNLERHFDTHGSEFPDLVDAPSYDRAMRAFLRDPPAGTRTIVRADGSVVQWHQRNNIFAIMGPDGAPQTMYRLDPRMHGQATNLKYFLSQMER